MTKDELIKLLNGNEWNAAFRRLGLCEQAGTGMRMVLNQWQALGHPEPEYDNNRSRKTFEIRLPLAKEQVAGEVTGEVIPPVIPPVTPPVSEQVASEVAGEATGEVQKFLKILHMPMSRSEAQIALNLKGQANFRDRYLKLALDLELAEMTIPDKPKSSKQKYRLTDKGKEWVKQKQAEK